MAFNPEKHLTDLRGKKYLETKWRIAWFREAHPRGQIGTEIINVEPLVMKATICDENGVILATGHGSAKEKAGAVWSGREIEKAETAAIGRALAHAGYGTQFTGESDADNLADSPVERRQPPRPTPPRREEPPAEPQSIEVVEVVVKKGSNGKPFLSFAAGDTHVTSFTREYLKGLIDDVTYASLATPGTYKLPPVKVFYLPSEDGKYKNVVRIEKATV